MRSHKIVFILKPFLLWVVAGFAILFLSHKAYGLPAEEFVINPANKIVTAIGKRSQTRISFPPFAIKEVVGDSNKYKIHHDSLGASIYLLPKAGIGEKIELTLITTGGKTQDFLFNVIDAQGRVIILKQEKTNNMVVNKIAEAKEMMKYMFGRRIGKYFVEDFSGKKEVISCKNVKKASRKGIPITCAIASRMPEELMGLDIKETHVYSYRTAGIKGIILEIKNNTKKPIKISEKNISTLFKNSILINIESQIISPKDFIYALIVLDTRKEE